MTREQELVVERLSLEQGGEALMIRDGFHDGHITVMERYGRRLIVDTDGAIIEDTRGFAVGWNGLYDETPAGLRYLGGMYQCLTCGARFRDIDLSVHDLANKARAAAHATECKETAA